MNLLVIGSYPHEGYIYSGVFNRRSVEAIKELAHQVEVLAPRPYVPHMLTLCRSRWKTYHQIPPRETRDGVVIHRPAYVEIPRFAGALCADPGRFLCCARLLKKRHQAVRFDAILGFDLILSGGLAWRLARMLKIPAAGWAFGGDVRVGSRSSYGRIVRLALQRLDMVFYQSNELRETAAMLSGKSPNQFHPDRHIVLSHGIQRPPINRTGARRDLRAELGIANDQVVVLYVGRIARPKGVYELMEAVRLANLRNPRIVCLMVGSNPVFDETRKLRYQLRMTPTLCKSVRILPACSPEQVWDYLYASDVFAFPSHNEGMPNSLLEAMAASLPAVAYGIPPVLEIDNAKAAVEVVSPFDVLAFSEAILELSESPNKRRALGEKGRNEVLGRFMAHKNMAEALRRMSLMVREGHASSSTALGFSKGQ